MSDELAADMSAALERLRAESLANSAPPGTGTMIDVRQRATRIYRIFNRQPPVLADVQDIDAEGSVGPCKIRLYRNHVPAHPQPVLVYAHGGGWIVGDLELEDWALRYLASKSNFAVASIDYALAPEHPFPQPVDDCVALIRWLRSNGERFALNTEQIAVGGGSAGANLMLAAALKLRDEQQTRLTSVTCFYGVFDTGFQSQSHALYHDERYQAGSPGMAFFLSKYLPCQQSTSDPYVHLVSANLAGLPPVFLHAAALDVLRDDSILMAERLTAAGVPNQLTVYPGTIHGFTVMAREVAQGRQALEAAATQIAQGFDPHRD